MSKERVVLRELKNAEVYARRDPPAALSKIRFIAEALTDIAANRAGESREFSDTQEVFLKRLEQAGVIPSLLAKQLHDLRVIGNKGVHEMAGTPEEALNAIATARSLVGKILDHQIHELPSSSTSARREAKGGSVLDRLKSMETNTRRATPAKSIRPLPLGWRDIFLNASSKIDPRSLGLLLGIIGGGPVRGEATVSDAQSNLPQCPADTKARWHNCVGSFTFRDGNKYVGKYVGEWRDNKRHGQGTYTFADGEKYEGEFSNGKIHGQGTYTFADGGKYVGEYRDDKRHGYGKVFAANGETVSEGYWVAGTYVGRTAP